MNQPNKPETEPRHLRRALTTPLLTLYGLGVTVGAGIYVLVGATVAQAGVFAPFSFVVAAIVVAFTAFSYSELSTRYPVSAGEAAYVEAAFRSGGLATFVGVAVALSGIVSASAVAIGAASYLSDITGFSPETMCLAVVVLMGGIALMGITQSVSVAAVITVIEISGLLLVITWGGFVAEPSGAEIGDMFPSLTGGHWIGIGAASLLAFYAFVGFEDMANVAEEVKDPSTTMPRAIIWTLIIATVLYVATTVSVLVAVPTETLAGSSAPLSLVFVNAAPEIKNLFAAVAVVATVNGVLIQMIMASRVLFGLADRGHLPAVLARISPRTEVPTISTLIVVGLIALFSQTLPIDLLAERTSQIVLFVFLLVNLALIRLKTKGPAVDQSCFVVPIAVPILGVVTSLLLLASAVLET